MIRGLVKFVSWERLWSEFWNLFRFGVVGVTSMGINAGVYALFSRVIWIHGNGTVQAMIAVVCSAIFNFTMHRAWTFRTSAFHTSMLLRYVAVIMVGSGIYGVLFYIGHELFGLFDFLVLVVATFMVAGFSYIAHRFFTFNARFNRMMITDLRETVLTPVGEIESETVGIEIRQQM